MSTPPPTETPAPLRSLTADEIASIERRLEYENIGKAWVRGLLATISNLRARNEALEAERDLILAGFNEAQALAAEQKARAEAAESTIARHVAALQEIGKGVEADQATIARLRAELAQADALAHKWIEPPLPDEDKATLAAIDARHRDRRALAVGRTEGEA